jgi:hypothetical protein
MVPYDVKYKINSGWSSHKARLSRKQNNPILLQFEGFAEEADFFGFPGICLRGVVLSAVILRGNRAQVFHNGVSGAIRSGVY